MMANRLAGKVAIVTGGGTGIGEAVCRKFAAEGAGVLVVGLADDPVEAAKRSHGQERHHRRSGECILVSGF